MYLEKIRMTYSFEIEESIIQIYCVDSLRDVGLWFFNSVRVSFRGCKVFRGTVAYV
jgi:hypothetical protein